MPCQSMRIWCILITSKMETPQTCDCWKTGFGLIPVNDVGYPHVKTFGKLFSVVYQVKRLLGASGNSHFLLTRRNACCMMCDGTQSPSHTSRHRSVIHHVSQVWWPSLSTFIHTFIHSFIYFCVNKWSTSRLTSVTSVCACPPFCFRLVLVTSVSC
jgi:hypothetical protein